MSVSSQFVTVGVMIILGSCSSAVSAQSASMLTSIPVIHPIASTSERLELAVRSRRILTLGTRIPRFQIHDEDVLDAIPVSDNRIEISAKKPGETQVNVWDTQDKLYTIDVTVVADASPIDNILNSQLPLASLKVTPINESAIVSGFVTRDGDVERAIAIASQFYKTVINNIEVAETTQVLLHTRIMEVSRTKLRQLGLSTPWCDSTSRTGETDHCFRIDDHFKTLIHALEQQDLVKVLASPTVVATDGQRARFFVGGRVPNVLANSTGQLMVEYQEYGTSIDFLPTVIAPDRIRLKVRSEVSTPEPSGAVKIGSSSVAAFATRYVETTVEMYNGETILLAGLMQSRDVSVVKRTPVLSNVPCLGALFRHVRCEHNEIELLITITPELVDAADCKHDANTNVNLSWEDGDSYVPSSMPRQDNGMIY